MAIARDATAWVLYDNGRLFRVETKNNLACTQAAWVPSTNGLKVFGMGFSTDQVGGTTDTLFIAGGSDPPPSSSFNSMTGARVGDPIQTSRSIVGAGVSTCAPVIL